MIKHQEVCKINVIKILQCTVVGGNACNAFVIGTNNGIMIDAGKSRKCLFFFFFK